jgi:Na+/melibiose symporter-like transporter
VLALAVVWFAFGKRERHERHRVDYVGAALLAAGTTAGLLAAVTGGNTYAWTSATVVGLFAACAVLLAAFVAWERRASEPILPPHLFTNRTFTASQVALFLVGAAMFGAIYFVPLFVQAVLRESATSSGAVLTPLMLGLIAASVLAGQLVSRTGRYRGVLLAGPPLMAAGFYLLTRIGVGGSSFETTRDVVLVGVGIGLVMQTFTVVVQNTVARREIGVATAATQFFRSIGATVGVTAMGAVVTARLGAHALARARPADLAAAIHPVFWVALALAGIAFVATLFVQHVELRTTLGDEPPGRPLARELGNEAPPRRDREHAEVGS